MVTRTAIGFLVAPLVVPIGMLLTSGLQSESVSELALEALVSIAVWYGYSLLFTFVIALPLYLLLNRLDFVHWWVSASAGLLVGGIGAASLNGQTTWFYARLVVLGGVSGLVFWLIAKYEAQKSQGTRDAA
jgi:hypothetical protein